jgi:hypothetical protein
LNDKCAYSVTGFRLGLPAGAPVAGYCNEIRLTLRDSKKGRTSTSPYKQPAGSLPHCCLAVKPAAFLNMIVILKHTREKPGSFPAAMPDFFMCLYLGMNQLAAR